MPFALCKKTVKKWFIAVLLYLKCNLPPVLILCAAQEKSLHFDTQEYNYYAQSECITYATFSTVRITIYNKFIKNIARICTASKEKNQTAQQNLTLDCGFFCCSLPIKFIYKIGVDRWNNWQKNGIFNWCEIKSPAFFLLCATILMIKYTNKQKNRHTTMIVFEKLIYTLLMSGRDFGAQLYIF